MSDKCVVRKAAYNKKFGLPIMAQKGNENEHLVVTIILPEKMANLIGDAVLDAFEREGWIKEN